MHTKTQISPMASHFELVLLCAKAGVITTVDSKARIIMAIWAALNNFALSNWYDLFICLISYAGFGEISNDVCVSQSSGLPCCESIVSIGYFLLWSLLPTLNGLLTYKPVLVLFYKRLGLEKVDFSRVIAAHVILIRILIIYTIKPLKLSSHYLEPILKRRK